MEGFTIIDGVVAVIIVLSALLAYARGIVREVMAIAGWVGAGILGYLFAPQVEPLVREIPGIGPFLADNCELSVIVAFALVFALALVVVSFFTPLFSSVVQRSALGGADQAIGFLFGVVRGVLLIAIAFFVYDTVMTGQSFDMVDQSRAAQVFERITSRIQEDDPTRLLAWITDQYEQLIGRCSN